MTQRVARPMKFAAFISIIISVAVMLAACQGAVGKPGDPGVTGPQGPKGEPGDPGTTGPAGHNAFIDLGKDKLVEVNIDSTNKNRAIAPSAIDVSPLFAGGTPPITYKRIAPETTNEPKEIDKNNLDPAATNSKTVYTSDISVGDPIPNGMLTVMVRESKKLENLTETAGDNFKSVVFKVEGTDAYGVAHEGLVKVRPNRAPTAGDKPIPELIVGTLGETTVDETKAKVSGFYPYTSAFGTTANGMLDRTALNCEMFNMCEKSLVSEAYYSDDGFNLAESVGLDNLTFTAIIDDSEKAEYIEVMPFTATGRNGLTIKGLKSTWNPKGGGDKKGADEPVTVTITAQDLNGLMDDTKTVKVSVNGAPERTDEPLPTETVKVEKLITIDLSLFFKDPEEKDEDEKLTFKAESSFMSRATATVVNDQLTIDGVGAGSTMVTVTASDTLAQWVKAEFEVTVTR